LAPQYSCVQTCQLISRKCSLLSTGCQWQIETADAATYSACLQSCAATPPPAPVCPEGIDSVPCFSNPCSTSSCPAHPTAECRPNYCGTCSAKYYDANNNEVSCDPPCGYRNCANCLLDTRCTFCHGEVSVSGVNVAPSEIASCFPASYSSNCATAGLSVHTDPNTCSPTLPEKPASQAVVNIDPVQSAVASGAASNANIQGRWTIVIVLVERQASNGGLQLINVFLNLIGADTPTAAEFTAICTIVNDAISPVIDIPVAQLHCEIGSVQVGAKRDANLMAVLSYQGASSSALALAPLSFISVAAAFFVRQL